MRGFGWLKRWRKERRLKKQAKNLTSQQKQYFKLIGEVTDLELAIEPKDLGMLKGLSQGNLHRILSEIKPDRLIDSQERRQKFRQMVLNGCIEFFNMKARGEKVIPIERTIDEGPQDPLFGYLVEYIREHWVD